MCTFANWRLTTDPVTSNSKEGNGDNNIISGNVTLSLLGLKIALDWGGGTYASSMKPEQSRIYTNLWLHKSHDASQRSKRLYLHFGEFYPVGYADGLFSFKDSRDGCSCEN